MDVLSLQESIFGHGADFLYKHILADLFALFNFGENQGVEQIHTWSYVIQVFHPFGIVHSSATGIQMYDLLITTYSLLYSWSPSQIVLQDWQDEAIEHKHRFAQHAEKEIWHY